MTTIATGVITQENNHAKSKLMSEMEPLEVCIVIDNHNDYNGHIVMRTASTFHFEVMCLTDMKENKCWTNKNTLIVAPYEGDSITINLKKA